MGRSSQLRLYLVAHHAKSSSSNALDAFVAVGPSETGTLAVHLVRRCRYQIHPQSTSDSHEFVDMMGDVDFSAARNSSEGRHMGW